jgi:hypothetical protein
MAQKIPCGNCGAKVPLPTGFSRAKIRCGACGYYAEVPEDLRSTPAQEAPQPAPVPRRPSDTAEQTDTPTESTPKKPKQAPAVRAKSNPRDIRPEFVVDEVAAPPLLVGSQDEDDGLPYSVSGSGLKECPECRNELPLDAVLCVHCGAELGMTEGKRTKRKRTYTLIDETFHEGFPPKTRMTMFLAMQVLNVLFTFGLTKATSVEFNGVAIGTALFALLINGGLQAFILGSYSSLRVQRNAKGKGTLTRQFRICFLPRPPVVVDWKPHAGVDRLIMNNATLVGWVVCLYLLGMGCLPGILFYFLELSPERYDVHLANTYRGVEEIIFRSRKLEQADRIVSLVADATGLQQPRRSMKSD